MFGDRSICSLALSLASSSMSPSRTAVPRLEDIPLTRPKPTCSREGARSEGRRHRSQAEKRASKWADWEWSTTYNRREGPYLKAEEVVGCIIFFCGGDKIFLENCMCFVGAKRYFGSFKFYGKGSSCQAFQNIKKRFPKTKTKLYLQH